MCVCVYFFDKNLKLHWSYLSHLLSHSLIVNSSRMQSCFSLFCKVPGVCTIINSDRKHAHWHTHTCTHIHLKQVESLDSLRINIDHIWKNTTELDISKPKRYEGGRMKSPNWVFHLGCFVIVFKFMLYFK